METKKLSLPEIVRNAQQASGGDCFGIDNDPEAIQALMKMAVERFRTLGHTEDLEAWAFDVLDLFEERFAWWREQNGPWLRAQLDALIPLHSKLSKETVERLNSVRG